MICPPVALNPLMYLRYTRPIQLFHRYCSSDDPSTGSPANLSEDISEHDDSTTLLLEQKMTWEGATTDTPADVQAESSLEPATYAT